MTDIVPVYTGFTPTYGVGASATREERKRLNATIEADRKAVQEAQFPAPPE